MLVLMWGGGKEITPQCGMLRSRDVEESFIQTAAVTGKVRAVRDAPQQASPQLPQCPGAVKPRCHLTLCPLHDSDSTHSSPALRTHTQAALLSGSS
ncbi:hypothetical protein SKAU_G00304520 [Synaphobranchus kaupii]|uniref:Uncharacterized protein n=1 Tax=Synaphobranchus kaupii TaxID=118154 RepID=A0A9Q1INC0_SYNKA|nr:hypothetical protein SKAU_G00304520 [Synaphobranchus kaupii]